MKKIYALFGMCFCATNVFAMADSTPPVYGVPTLYGEYEISSDDTRRASNMYGNIQKHPAAIRAGVIKNTPTAKHPVKAKKAAPKKKKAKKKQVPAKTSVVAQQSESVIDKNVPEMVVVSVAPAPVDTKAVVAVPRPSQDAIDIAVHAANKTDTESFCTQIKRQGKGNLPDGIIMMPGRPDLMSCVSNNSD